MALSEIGKELDRFLFRWSRSSNDRSLNNFIVSACKALRKHWEGQEDISIWTFSRRSRLYSVERAIPKIFTCPRGRPRTYSDEESGRVASISFSSGRSNQPRVTKLPAVGRTPESSLVTNPDLLSQPPVEEKSVDLESTVESDSFRYHNIKFSRMKFTADEGV